MKVAVIGGGPLGIHMALRLHALEAAVTLYSPQLGGTLRRLAPHIGELSLEASWGELTSEEGRDLVSFSESLDHKPTLGEYWQKYLLPLSLKLPFEHISAPVIRVHKRFLGIEEDIPGKSRLHDLFRVVYRVKGRELLQEQQETNPEMFQKIETSLLSSLEEDFEGYHDYDLVIDATGVLHSPRPMGAGNAWALGEERLCQQKHFPYLFYGIELLEKISSLPQEMRRVALVGTGMTGALALLKLSPRMLRGDMNVILITQEKEPFSHFSKTHPKIFQKLSQLLHEIELKERQREDEFEVKLREWRDLEDYQRVKVPRPEEPEKILLKLPGHNVTSLDHLIDQESIFLTVERCDFRFSQLEWSSPPLRTYGVQGVFVTTGYQKSLAPFSSLRLSLDDHQKTITSESGTHPEPGFYTLGPVKSEFQDRYSLSQGLKQKEKIISDIRSYFSPVEAGVEDV